MSLVELLLHKLNVGLEAFEELEHIPSNLLELANLFILLFHLALGNIAYERKVILQSFQVVFRWQGGQQGQLVLKILLAWPNENLKLFWFH